MVKLPFSLETVTHCLIQPHRCKVLNFVELRIKPQVQLNISVHRSTRVKLASFPKHLTM